MEETQPPIKDKEGIFQLISERLSSPLFFSFIISFFIYNKNLTLALLFYSNDTLLKLYGQDLICYISGEYAKANSVYHPFIIAIFYTFFSPIIKEIIDLFKEFISKCFLKFKLDVQKLEPLTLIESAKLRNELLAVQNDNIKYFNRTVINDRNLIGHWTMSSIAERGGILGVETIKFENNSTAIWQETLYTVRNFIISDTNSYLSFMLLDNNKQPVYYFELQFIPPRDYNFTIKAFSDKSTYICFNKNNLEFGVRKSISMVRS